MSDHVKKESENLCKTCFLGGGRWPKVQCDKYPMFGYNTVREECDGYITEKEKNALIYAAHLDYYERHGKWYKGFRGKEAYGVTDE